MWGTLGFVGMVLVGLLGPPALVRAVRWRAARKRERLRAGLTVRISCRLESGSAARGRPGRLIARGLGGPLAFQPRFLGARPLAAQGMVLSVERVPEGVWDDPDFGVRVIHYRTPAGRTLRLRLRAPHVDTVSELLTARGPVRVPAAGRVRRRRCVLRDTTLVLLLLVGAGAGSGVVGVAGDSAPARAVEVRER